MTSRKGSGQAASQMQVNVWDVCYKAGNPLTVEEIASALTKAGRQLVSDALVWYKAKCETDNPGSTAMWSTDKRPPQSTIDNAWLAFVRHDVQIARGEKRIFSTCDDGVNPKDTTAIRRYSANPDKRPKVWRSTTVICRDLVDYDPDYREQTNTAHAVGMEFLTGYDQLDRNGHRPTNAQLRKLCDLAAQAIRVPRREQAS